ncbi:MAG: hypothetical protein GF329_16745 [Candidatus Lokiarchaeota archaeon]|nr:hypothetical protein [Candidatus Lokiarchaeota archaeon]
MGTDTTGVNPKGFERRYGEDNVYNAMLNCTRVISVIISEIIGLNINETFQVDLLNHQIENNTSNFQYPTYHGSLNKNNLSFSIETDSSDPTYSPTIAVTNNTFEDMNYNLLEVNFNGTGDWFIDKPNYISLTLNIDSSKIIYCPSITDSINLTKNMSRNDYQTDPVFIYLPLSNGLIYIPNSSSSNSGLAFINNCSSRHSSILWERDFLRYEETGGIHLNASYKIIILEDISLKKAVNFAQRINNQPIWKISSNIEQMGGYYSYDLYQKMLNKDK